MARGYIKFNVWSKETPLTDDNMKIFVNAGIGKQKFNSYCVKAEPLNKFGKLPENAHLSNGTSRAINAFFEQIEPDFEVAASELKRHDEPSVETHLGEFCITDIASVKGVSVGADGFYLVNTHGEKARIWHLECFFHIEL